MRMLRWLIAMMAALSLCVAPAAARKGPKPAKTEMSKAVGKCVGAVLGGALLGALLGGKKNRGAGAALGAGAGAATCAVLVAAAKRQDRLIEAQRAAVAAQDAQVHMATYQDEAGKEVRVASRAEDVTITQPLIPVSYQVDGAERVSPALATAAPVCRRVSSELSGESGSAAIPGQLYCRTDDGVWEPYAIGNA